MRTHRVVAVALIAVAGAHACGSFTEGEAPVVDGGGDAAPAPDATPPSSCVAEVPWALPEGGVPTVATCDGTPNVDLLTSPGHCGRCGRSCGGATCSGGLCERKQHDPNYDFILAADESAIYFERAGIELARLTLDGTSITLGAVDEAGVEDAGGSTRIFAATVDGDRLWLRARGTLYETSKTTPTPFVLRAGGLAGDEFGGGVAATSDKVFLSLNRGARVVAVDKASGPVENVSAATFPWLVRRVADRIVWTEAPWTNGFTPPSALKAARGGAVTTLFQSAGDLVGMAARDEDLYVTELVADASSVLRVGLDGTVEAFSVDPTISPPSTTSSLVAVDETFVYWTRPLAPPIFEVVKRARCGGATVRIMEVYVPVSLAVLGDRVYVTSSSEGLLSAQK